MLVRMLANWAREIRSCARTSTPGVSKRALERARKSIASSDLATAEAHVRAALERGDHPADAHRLLGSLLGASGRLAEAKDALEHALILEPDHPEGLTDLGNVYFLLGEIKRAEVCFRKALDVEPSHRVPRFALARLEEYMGHDTSAIDALQPLLDEPAFPPAIQMLVRLLDRHGRVPEAKRICTDVLSREPGHGAAEAALGFLLLKRELNPESALLHIETAIQAGFRDEDTLSNLGIALQDLGRLDDALECYDAALRLRPDYHPARFHRALARLSRGEFAQAWIDYEARLESKDVPVPSFQRPRWSGAPLSETTLLVYGEQGIGDQIMFASCLPDLMDLCPHLIVTCADKLEAIFQRSFPQITAIAERRTCTAENIALMRRAAMAIPIGSLPQYFRSSKAGFPPHKGYLRASADLVAHYRERLQAMGNDVKVGISWRGGTDRSRQATRSLDEHHLAAIFDTPGIHFVDLQYDSAGDEPMIADAIARGRLTHWGEALADYDHTAALVSSLDVVVSVTTAVIHLAGALGRPVWVMVPFSPEWRYGISGDRMPWYPSARIFRQRDRGDWVPVVADVRAQLRELAA